MPTSEEVREKAYADFCAAVSAFCAIEAGEDTIVDDFLFVAHSSSFGEDPRGQITIAVRPNQPGYRSAGLISAAVDTLDGGDDD